MTRDDYKFKLYYMGSNSSSTSPPSFANAVYIRDVGFKLISIPTSYTSGTVLGTANSDGSITFNTTGNNFNSQAPLNKNRIMFTSTTRSNALNNFYNLYSREVYDLCEYVRPTTYNVYYWFCIANDTAYAAFPMRYFSTSVGNVSNMIGWEVYTRNLPIRLISNGSAIPNTNVSHVLSCSESVCNSGGYIYTTYLMPAKVGADWKTVLFQFNRTISSPTNQFTYYINWTLTANEKAFIENGEYLPPPYDDGPTSTEAEGGTGTFDSSSDDISLPTIPVTNVSNAGFVRIYNPTLAQLQSLASYMWTDTTFLQTVVNHAKQLFENPMQAVISLNILPCSIPEGALENVKVLFIDTGIQMAPATTQFVEVNCGTYTLREYYGSALDYSPYTKVHCYLPYIGQVTLDTDEVMNKTLSIKYRIDIVTGMCVALISVGDSVLYQFSGHCAISMPLTSADFSNYISATISAAKIATGVVAGAAGARGVASALTGTAPPRSSSSVTKQTTRNPKTGRQVTAGTEVTVRQSSGASFGEYAATNIANSVDTVMGAKFIVEHSGGFTGNSGYLAVRRPYLIIEIPRMCNPVDYGVFNGYPSMLTLKLGDCTGYTKVQEIHLKGFSATNPEMSEISELLKAGVVI